MCRDESGEGRERKKTTHHVKTRDHRQAVHVGERETAVWGHMDMGQGYYSFTDILFLEYSKKAQLLMLEEHELQEKQFERECLYLRLSTWSSRCIFFLKRLIQTPEKLDKYQTFIFCYL